MSSKDTQFQEGVSGNPGGRPKGSKNKITLQKIMLEEQLRDASKDRMGEVLDKAFELALAGDRTMLKLLLELHMSKGIAESTTATEKVVIDIKTTAAPAAPSTNEPSVLIEEVKNG